MASDPSAELGSITTALLDRSGTPGSWREAAGALFELCTGIAPLAPNEVPSADHDETILPTGKAISTVDAARCIWDFERTRTFLIGVERAIRRVQHRPVHALYAGTGPYAPLVVPLTTVFGPDELRVTLIDVHPSSVERLATVIRAMRIDEHVLDLRCADATTFEPAGSPPVDVVVVEAMQRALTREPQVAVAGHLLRRLPPTAVLVPEVVTITARLATPGAHPGPSTTVPDRDLGVVLALDAAWARSATDDVVPCAELALDQPAADGQVLTLDTTVRVADGVELAPGASGITMREHLWEVVLDRAPATLSFAYRISTDPGFVCTVDDVTR